MVCRHIPRCPAAGDPVARSRARTIADQSAQGWALLCNGVIVFDDDGCLVPDEPTGVLRAAQ